MELIKNLIILFIACLLASPVLGFVIYDTTVQGNAATTQITLGLSSTSSVNYWDLSFLLPENTEVLAIEDTVGPITQYSQSGKNLDIKTNNGPQRTKEVVTITIKTNNVVDPSYSPLNIVKLSYSGFETESTVINIQSDKKIITSNIPFGFSINKTDNTLKVSGTGPANIIYTSSDTGQNYNNYVAIGNGDLLKTDELNQIVPRIIGIIPYYNKFPVVILPDREYNQNLDSFSAGTYKTGGIIIIPESKISKKEGTGILIHETVHAYNDQILRWSNTNVGWFDEGTATYSTWIANQLTGIRQPEIFGNSVEYYEGFVKYTIPSEGSRDDLWNYYQNNQDFMKYWKSHDPEQNENTRRFGYAFSQLMIRHYIYENGPEALHKLYSDLNKIDHRVETAEEYNQIVLSAMGSDMKPCYSESRQEFDQCLDKINDMKAIVPEVQAVKESYGTEINTEKLLNETYATIEKEKNEWSMSKIIFKISEAIERFVVWLNGLF